MSGNLIYHDNTNFKYLIYFSLKLNPIVSFQISVFGMENRVTKDIKHIYIYILKIHCGTKKEHLS